MPEKHAWGEGLGRDPLPNAGDGGHLAVIQVLPFHLPDADQAAQFFRQHGCTVVAQSVQLQVNVKVVVMAVNLQAFRQQLQLREQAKQTAQNIGLGICAQVIFDACLRTVLPGIATVARYGK